MNEKERTYRLRTILVRKLKKKSGKSWTTISDECFVHPGTIKRWMAGKEAMMDNIGLLAKALNTTADKIILPDGEEDLTDYVDGEVTVDGDLSDLKQPDDITAILEETQKRIGSKYRVMLMYVGEGSIRIGIKLHAGDALKLTRSFLKGQLADLKITSVSLTSYLQQEINVKKIECPQCRFVFSLDPRLSKRIIVCPHCLQRFRVRSRPA